MCGIAGIINTNKHSLAKLKKMLVRLNHRGPDGEGMWHDNKVVLGMRRLSIIDLTGGMQPLFNENKSIVIVGNGEIYNYKQLSKDIKRKGHILRTESDIETIIHLYEEYGIDCVKKLTGMFAFALYDIKKQKVFIARDRLGEKPLYYSNVNGSFYFSSEMKSLISVVPHKKIDLDAVNLYFHYYFIPEPRTIFSNIAKLAPAHYITHDVKTNKSQIFRYWDPADYKPTNQKDPVQELMGLLKKSVQNTLVADVDIAVSLSGGLDSSTILALAAAKYPKKLNAFTVGYENMPASDERTLAHKVTEKYNVNHIQTELKTNDVVEHYPQLVYDGDDPVSDIAGHAIYSVARLARSNGLKVLIGGIGGDELFWGYRWVREATLYNAEHKDFHFYDNTTPFKQAENFISRLTTDTFNQSVSQSLPFRQFQPTKLMTNQENARYSQDLIRDFWLVSNCIAYNDRLSMASSIELRSPLLNHKLIQAAYKSKKNVLSYTKDGKYWLRKVVKNMLPKEIYNAPKRGFQPPVARWLFAILLRYSNLLKNGSLVKSNILDNKSVSCIANTWILRPYQWPAIYQLLTLEIWFREYINGQTPQEIRNG